MEHYYKCSHLVPVLVYFNVSIFGLCLLSQWLLLIFYQCNFTVCHFIVSILVWVCCLNGFFLLRKSFSLFIITHFSRIGCLWQCHHACVLPKLCPMSKHYLCYVLICQCRCYHVVLLPQLCHSKFVSLPEFYL